MAAVVYATPGKLYLYSSAPSSVASGGTELPGIQERNIRFDPGLETRRRLTGCGVNSGFRERRGRVTPSRLIVPLRSQAAAELKILFSHLTTDGATIRPRGGTAAAPFAKMPTFDIVLRPDNSSEKYTYSPRWAMTQETAALFTSSDDFSQLDGVELVLEAGKLAGATTPAVMRDSAANINTAYGYGEA